MSRTYCSSIPKSELFFANVKSTTTLIKSLTTFSSYFSPCNSSQPTLKPKPRTRSVQSTGYSEESRKNHRLALAPRWPFGRAVRNVERSPIRPSTEKVARPHLRGPPAAVSCRNLEPEEDSGKCGESAEIAGWSVWWWCW